MSIFKFIGLLSILLAVVAVGVFYWFEQQKSMKNKQVTCLASVIPKVVLHHNQEEIVNLLQDLAEDTGDLAPQAAVKAQSQPIFSQRIDKKLIEIANLYQQQPDASLSQGAVAIAVDEVTKYFQKDAPQFLGGCMNILSQAESQCGSLDKVSDENKQCFNSFTPKITALMEEFLPEDESK